MNLFNATIHKLTAKSTLTTPTPTTATTVTMAAQSMSTKATRRLVESTYRFYSNGDSHLLAGTEKYADTASPFRERERVSRLAFELVVYLV